MGSSWLKIQIKHGPTFRFWQIVHKIETHLKVCDLLKQSNQAKGGGLYAPKENNDLQEKIAYLTREVESLKFVKNKEPTIVCGICASDTHIWHSMYSKKCFTSKQMPLTHTASSSTILWVTRATLIGGITPTLVGGMDQTLLSPISPKCLINLGVLLVYMLKIHSKWYPPQLKRQLGMNLCTLREHE